MDADRIIIIPEHLRALQETTQLRIQEKLTKACQAGPFFVKKMFSDSNGFEFLWCEVVAIDDETLEVESVLIDHPEVVSDFSQNDHVTIAFKDIIEIESIELGTIL